MKVLLSQPDREWITRYAEGLRKYTKKDRDYVRKQDRILQKFKVATPHVDLKKTQLEFITNFVQSVRDMAEQELANLIQPPWYEVWKVSRNKKLKSIRTQLTRTRDSAAKVLEKLKMEERIDDAKQISETDARK